MWICASSGRPSHPMQPIACLGALRQPQPRSPESMLRGLSLKVSASSRVLAWSQNRAPHFNSLSRTRDIRRSLVGHKGGNSWRQAMMRFGATRRKLSPGPRPQARTGAFLVMVFGLGSVSYMELAQLWLAVSPQRRRHDGNLERLSHLCILQADPAFRVKFGWITHCTEPAERKKGCRIHIPAALFARRLRLRTAFETGWPTPTSRGPLYSHQGTSLRAAAAR